MTKSTQITAMIKGGAVLAQVLTDTLTTVRAGMTTARIDQEITRRIDRSGAKPSFTTVRNYRFYSCIGLNHEVVHSLPSQDKTIKVEDLLKVDTGLIWSGWHTDVSWTVQIGQTGRPEFDSPFLNVGKLALKEAIQQCLPGKHVGDISQAIQYRIESAGYHVVKQLTGHCIGKKLHEKPFIPGFLNGTVDKTPELVPGMTLAIEVIYAQGTGQIVVENDGWTISTQDGKMSALFEQTVAVTTDLPLVLTPMPHGF